MSVSKGIVIATGIFPPDIGGPASYSVTLASRVSKKTPVSVITYSNVYKDKQDGSYSFKVSRIWKKIPKGLRHLIYFLRIYYAAKNADTILALNAVSAGVPARWAAKF